MKSITFLLILAGLASAVEFDAIKILPRQDDHANSQTVKNWKLEVSDRGTEAAQDWVQVASGTFDSKLSEKTVSFTKRSARFVRFIATSGHSGGNNCAIGEINLALGGVPLDRARWIAAADSALAETANNFGPAAYAIDGKPATCWHTIWQQGATPFPHVLTIDTQADVVVGDRVTLEWLPNPENNIAGYNIAYGTNPASLEKSVVTGNVAKVEIQNLTPGTWYFAMKVRNTEGVASFVSSPPLALKVVVAPVNPAVPPSTPSTPKGPRHKR